MLSPQQIQAATTDDEAKLARRAWLLPTLRRMHPRLKATDPALLVEANRLHAHGLLRRWALLLELLLLVHPGGGGFTRTDFEDALTAITGDTPTFAA